MSKKQKLESGSYFQAWIWQHIFRKKVVWLECTTFGYKRLWLSYVKRPGISYVYPYYNIGQVKLNKNGTTSGDTSYIKYWKPYKRGVKYRRPRMANGDPNGTITTSFATAFTTTTVSSGALNQASLQQANTLLQQSNLINAAYMRVGRSLTAKQAVDQLNAEMMRKHKANLRISNNRPALTGTY